MANIPLKTIIFAFLGLLLARAVIAQDTVQVSQQTFIERGLKNSQQVNAEQQKVKLANNKVRQVQSKRYLPKFDLSTQHGVVPGVTSNREDLAPDEYYLDPNLSNDFGDLGIFTRGEIEAVQPIYTWGALKNAVKASKSAAEAAENKLEITEDETRLRLYKLYQSYLLSLEVQRLLHDAQKQIDQIDKKLTGTTNDSTQTDSTTNANIDESDIFKFKVFKSEFAVRAAEVKENAQYVQRVWDFVMQADDSTVYVPKKRFLDPVANELKSIGYYKNKAFNNRPEVKALNAGINAADYGVKATKAQRYPQLLLGISASFAYTPNRPRQSNPFIINNTNYFSPKVGFLIRQNLDFFSLHYDVKKSKLQRKQAQFSKDAALQGIVLQLNEKYKNASVSKIKIQRINDALITAKKWVRQEKLDYDLDLGDPKDLIDAIKKELELRISYKQAIFNFNEDVAELYKAAALPVTSLEEKYSAQ